MDQNLKEYMEENNIEYKTHKHLPVFTVEEHYKLMGQIKGVLHTKNLFLRSEKGNLYLVSMYANKRLDMKMLSRKIRSGKLSFASPNQLKFHLNLTPGSVSIFGMIYAKSVILILDKQVWDAEKVGFHPNINTSTLEITHENLEKFYNTLKSQKLIVDLDHN